MTGFTNHEFLSSFSFSSLTMPAWNSSSTNLSNLSLRWTGILLDHCFLNVASFLSGIWNLCLFFQCHFCDENIHPDPLSASELGLQTHHPIYHFV